MSVSIVPLCFPPVFAYEVFPDVSLIYVASLENFSLMFNGTCILEKLMEKFSLAIMDAFVIGKEKNKIFCDNKF